MSNQISFPQHFRSSTAVLAALFSTLLLSGCPSSGTDSKPVASNPTYRLTTDYQGDQRALSVVDNDDADGTENTQIQTQLRLRDAADIDTQRWVFSKLDNGGYKINNVAIGNTYSIDVLGDGLMDKIVMAPTRDASGQIWIITPKANGFCQLTNEFTGSEIALDIAPEGEQDVPRLFTAGDFSGQSWRFTPNNSVQSTDEVIAACFER